MESNAITRVREYFESPALSQSTLKMIWSNPLKYLSEDKEPEWKQHFERGSAVDCLVTSPEVFDLYYYVADGTKPSAALKRIIDDVYDSVKEYGYTRLQDNVELLNHFRNQYQYHQKLHDETYLNKVYEECTSYWDLLHNSNDRTVLTTEESEFYNRIADSLKVVIHKLTGHFRVEPVGQYPVYWNQYGVRCKGLIDLMFRTSSGAYIFDIKTTEIPLWHYEMQIMNLRTDLQMSWYKRGVQASVSDNVHNPTLIVESAKVDYIGEPMLYKLSDTDIAIGKYGFSTDRTLDINGELVMSKSYSKPGWRDMLKAYKWHEGSGNWNLPYHVAMRLDMNNFSEITTQIW